MSESATDLRGRTRQDRDIEDTMRRLHGPAARTMLKRMEDKRKPRQECQWCVTSEDKLFPISVEICTSCVRKITARYGNILITGRTRNYLAKKPCELCMLPKVSHFPVNMMVCQKCLSKLGHKYTSTGEFTNERRKYERRAEEIARRVA
jgi:ribosomal protein L37AE/L43A